VASDNIDVTIDELSPLCTVYVSAHLCPFRAQLPPTPQRGRRELILGGAHVVLVVVRVVLSRGSYGPHVVERLDSD